MLSCRDGELGTQARLAPIIEAAIENASWDVRSIALGGLAQPAMAELVKNVLARERAPTDTQVSEIVREAQGSPFWARELCANLPAEVESARIGSLAELLTKRLRALPDAPCRLAETAALAGRPLSVKTALAASGATYAELDLLCEARLVRLGPGNARDERKQVHSYHDRVRESLRDGVPPASRAGRRVRRSPGESASLGLGFDFDG